MASNLLLHPKHIKLKYFDYILPQTGLYKYYFDRIDITMTGWFAWAWSTQLDGEEGSFQPCSAQHQVFITPDHRPKSSASILLD